ncbi:MAG TPA: SDR family oxidoreductase [Gemmatimonadaceae bacterium]|nr:SDR family oxidoreductase [Gemmatimonadaceae bacterium]
MILLVGATGLVGGMIARTLLNQRRPLRILVREGRDYQALIDAGAEAALGDLKHPETLAAACRGVDVVITTASAGQRGGLDTPETVDLEGNRNLVEAARSAGVKQFIFVSALTATLDHPVPLPRAKAQAEGFVRESGIPYTIVAANGIMDVMVPQVVTDRIRAGQPVTLVGEARRRHSFVAARDVAAFAVAAVNHPEAINRRIAVAGPEAVSWRDIVATHERAIGRSVSVQWIAPGELLPDLPPIPGLTELVSGLLAALETFDTPVDMSETARTFAVPLTSLDDYVAAAMLPDMHSTTGVPARA